MKPCSSLKFRPRASALPLLVTLLWIIPSVSPLSPLSSAARAQQRGAAQRVVQGKVTDKADAALRGAVVYLKDDHTLAVKSFISDDNGGFRFGQLSTSTDYEVWAEAAGKKSAVKSISSFDSKTDITINLKIDTGK